jgi:hypothetical protein
MESMAAGLTVGVTAGAATLVTASGLAAMYMAPGKALGVAANSPTDSGAIVGSAKSAAATSTSAGISTLAAGGPLGVEAITVSATTARAPVGRTTTSADDNGAGGGFATSVASEGVRISILAVSEKSLTDTFEEQRIKQVDMKMLLAGAAAVGLGVAVASLSRSSDKK